MNEASGKPVGTELIDEVKRSIAEKVREDSKVRIKLTGLASLTPPDSSLKEEEAKLKIAEMAEDPEYQDIKSLMAVNGAAYLYSSRHISDSYAAILARVEANDPCFTIAGTVRDEARIYRRPTKYEFLTEPLFNIKSEELGKHIKATLEREDFRDIKSITASTGVRYLYSDLYLSERYARRQVEWDEVEKFENP